jgi:hypothetical protein
MPISEVVCDHNRIASQSEQMGICPILWYRIVPFFRWNRAYNVDFGRMSPTPLIKAEPRPLVKAEKA